MKKILAVMALTSMVVVGCAHKEKGNMGGSSDQSISGSSSQTGSSYQSNPSRSSTVDSNSSLSDTNSNSSKPQQQ